MTRNCRYSVRFWVARALTLVIIVLLIAIGARAESVNDSSEPVDSVIVVDTVQRVIEVDTTLFRPQRSVPTSARVSNPVNLEDHLYQNPTVALFKSMLVPGLGQLGNRRYIKATAIIGLQTWFIGSAVHYGQQASDARRIVDRMTTDESRVFWYSFYDNKRKNRNKFIWFAGITAFISMFDAYVDAHLSGSPTDKRNEKFSFEVNPDLAGGVSAQLALNF